MKDFGITMTWFAVAVVAGLGYIMNIIKLVNADAITGMVIARVAGIFVAPLGAVLGYF